MPDLTDLIAEVEAEGMVDQAGVEALLLPYRDNQDAAALYGKEAGRLGKIIKEWLVLNPGLDLADGEHGLVARLQTRKLPGHKYDLVAIIENNPALFARLISTRALRVDHDAAVAADLGGEVKKYEIPAGETSALLVVRL
jgi:hypothetical protein